MINCYQCGTKYPDFMFAKDRRKFQLPIAKGRVRICRVCTWKNISNGNRVVRYNFTTDKFEIVVLTLKQRIKEFFR